MAAKKTQSGRAKQSANRSASKSVNQAVETAVVQNKLNSQKKGSLKQTSILVLSCITAVIVLALLTYNPDDPGLFQYDSNGVVSNKAGSFGAYIASVLFGFFGNVAYLVPVAFLVPVFLMFRSDKKSAGGINTGITVFGVFLALLAGCGLATLLWPDSTLIYKAGGLLGLMVSKIVVHMLGMLGATLFLFTLFMAGITLFADIHWLRLIDKIGDTILGIVELFGGSSQSPKTANAGINSGQIPFSAEDYDNNQKVSKVRSGSMLDALGDGVRSLFVSRKNVSARASTGYDDNLNAPWADEPIIPTGKVSKKRRSNEQRSRSENDEPFFDDVLNESIVPVERQEPVLGFPEHMLPGGDSDSADLTPTHKSRKSSKSASLNPLNTLRKVAKTAVSGKSKAKHTTDKNHTSPSEMTQLDAEHLVADHGPDLTQQPITQEKSGLQITVQGPRHTPAKIISGGKNSSKKTSGKGRASRPTVALDKAVKLPPISLLNPPPATQGQHSREVLETHARNIVITLEHYGVRGVEIDCYYPGPIITRYELLLPPGTKVSKITGLSQDIARSMCVSSIRIVEVIQGKTTIGVEVPNETRDLVAISDVLDSGKFRDAKSPLSLVLGKTIAGKPAVADLARMPHLLIAGTTGSGKSVGVNAMLMSLLYKSTPDDVRLILIDPKMLELSIYEGIPHLLTSVVTDMKDAANSLRWAVGEMERRYALMSHLKVRNIGGYNAKVKEAIAKGEPITDPTFDPTQHVDVRPNILEPLPYIVIVIDEFADMMMVVGKKVEELIARLAQKARAAGIHLILATQRPSVDVITGLIKANIPSRIAFQVSTKIDSRTILDQGGAESLLGHGDMLYLPPGTGLPQRIHGAFVADSEVEEVVNHWKLQGEPEYLEDVLSEKGSSDAIPGLEPLAESESDPLYDQAVAIVTESRRASISYVQRRLKVGYNRAASMIEDMEKAGVVSAVQSNGTREVLAPEPPKP